MATNKEVVRVLKKALKLMNKNGAHWLQNCYTDEHGPDGEFRYCSVGAVNSAVGLYEQYSPELHEKLVELRTKAVDALAHGLPAPPYKGLEDWTAVEKVTIWNDSERRRWPDVVKRFTRAIERLEGK